MAVPFSHAASSYLDNYDRELNDALKRQDGVIAVLCDKGKIREETSGGPNFVTRVMYAGNPNVGFGSTTGQVSTLQTEGKTMASVPQRFIRGSVVLNDVEVTRAARNGEWALGSYIKEEMLAAKGAYVQTWADALRQATPGANDPLTLLPASADAANGILSPQAPASQTATTAGISRADNSWWRNQYSNTSIDISAESGRALLHRRYLDTVFGSSQDDEPDFGLTTALVISDLAATVDSNKRADYLDKKLVNFGVRGIMFQNAMLVRDSSTRLDNKVCFLNSRDLYIKFLRQMSHEGFNPSKESWDQNNENGSVPVNVLPFIHDIDSFHTISLFSSIASLVPAQLRTHGLNDNVV